MSNEPNNAITRICDACYGNRVCDQTKFFPRIFFFFLVHFCLFIYLFISFAYMPFASPRSSIDVEKTAACSSSSCYYYYNNACKVSTVRSCWIVKRPDALSRFFNSHPFPWPLHAETPLSLLGHPLPPLLSSSGNEKGEGVYSLLISSSSFFSFFKRK